MTRTTPVGPAANPAQDRGTFTRHAAMASVAVAVLLLALKGYASAATGSIAMLGSLADTALDLVASLVTLTSVIYAAQPADREHRFGHGKAEALAALFQVTLVTLSAIAIGWRAVQRFMTGEVTAEAESGIVVSLIAIVATFALLAYQRRAIRRTGSVAIEADHLHYQSDLLLNGSVIAALALDQFAGIGWADPAFGIAIALWLAWGAIRGASRAFDELMDKEWPREKRERLLALAAKHPQLRGIHDLRTRTSGQLDFVQFHVWVDGSMTVRAAHDVMDDIEELLSREFPGVEFLIHPDPEGLVDEDPLGAEDLTADLPQIVGEKIAGAAPRE